MIRAATSLVLLAAMCAFGLGVYHGLDSLKGRPPTAERSTVATRSVPLPGTLYVAEAGALYSVRNGVFKQLTKAEGWMQPAISPDGRELVAVKRDFNYSDLYVLGLNGEVRAQLTHNASSVVEQNHWAFFPRFSPDGSAVYYSYDPKDPFNTYRVDLAVFALTFPPARPLTRQWSFPNHYTGGDVNPVPLRSGALVYSKFAIDQSGRVYSQVWIQARPGSPGVGLTGPEDDCSQPAVSPDETRIAMVCSQGQQLGVLEVANLDTVNFQIGPALTVLHGVQVAAPTFSPDGTELAFFAPTTDGGPFQLWTIKASPEVPAGPSTPAAGPGSNLRQITTNIALDAQSPVVWAR